MKTHVQVPFADHRGGNIYRVYFGTRDAEVRSRVAWFEFDIESPRRILRVSEQPALDLGERGCFDDNGVTPSWIVNRGDEKYLYYFGWNRGTTVAFHIYAGVAVSRNGGETFERIQKTPMLDRVPDEPFLSTLPCVMPWGDEWRLWYGSAVSYDYLENGVYYPRCRIKTTRSSDGIHWDRPGTVCIDFEAENEYAISRPCVRPTHDGYEMWYGHKGESYRLGCAVSPDGINWSRRDEEVGIDVSPEGWDSQMLEYAHVFSHGDWDYMLYVGNEYGKTGVGLARRLKGVPS